MDKEQDENLSLPHGDTSKSSKVLSFFPGLKAMLSPNVRMGSASPSSKQSCDVWVNEITSPNRPVLKDVNSILSSFKPELSAKPSDKDGVGSGLSTYKESESVVKSLVEDIVSSVPERSEAKNRVSGISEISENSFETAIGGDPVGHLPDLVQSGTSFQSGYGSDTDTSAAYESAGEEENVSQLYRDPSFTALYDIPPSDATHVLDSSLESGSTIAESSFACVDGPSDSKTVPKRNPALSHLGPDLNLSDLASNFKDLYLQTPAKFKLQAQAQADNSVLELSGNTESEWLDSDVEVITHCEGRPSDPVIVYEGKCTAHGRPSVYEVPLEDKAQTLNVSVKTDQTEKVVDCVQLTGGNSGTNTEESDVHEPDVINVVDEPEVKEDSVNAEVCGQLSTLAAALKSDLTLAEPASCGDLSSETIVSEDGVRPVDVVQEISASEAPVVETEPSVTQLHDSVCEIELLPSLSKSKTPIDTPSTVFEAGSPVAELSVSVPESELLPSPSKSKTPIDTPPTVFVAGSPVTELSVSVPESELFPSPSKSDTFVDTPAFSDTEAPITELIGPIHESKLLSSPLKSEALVETPAVFEAEAPVTEHTVSVNESELSLKSHESELPPLPSKSETLVDTPAVFEAEAPVTELVESVHESKPLPSPKSDASVGASRGLGTAERLETSLEAKEEVSRAVLSEASASAPTEETAKEQVSAAEPTKDVPPIVTPGEEIVTEAFLHKPIEELKEQVVQVIEEISPILQTAEDVSTVEATSSDVIPVVETIKTIPAEEIAKEEFVAEEEVSPAEPLAVEVAASEGSNQTIPTEIAKEEVEFVQTEEIPKEEVSEIVTAEEIPKGQVSEIVTAEEIPKGGVSEIVTGEEILNEEVSEIVTAEEISNEEVSEIVTAEEILNEEVSEIVTAEEISNEEVSEIVTAEEIPKEEVSEIVTTEDIPKEEVSEAVTAEDTSKGDVSKAVSAEAISKEEVSEAVSAEDISKEEVFENVSAVEVHTEIVSAVTSEEVSKTVPTEFTEEVPLIEAKLSEDGSSSQTDLNSARIEADLDKTFVSASSENTDIAVLRKTPRIAALKVEKASCVGSEPRNTPVFDGGISLTSTPVENEVSKLNGTITLDDSIDGGQLDATAVLSPSGEPLNLTSPGKPLDLSKGSEGPLDLSCAQAALNVTRTLEVSPNLKPASFDQTFDVGGFGEPCFNSTFVKPEQNSDKCTNSTFVLPKEQTNTTFVCKSSPPKVLQKTLFVCNSSPPKSQPCIFSPAVQTASKVDSLTSLIAVCAQQEKDLREEEDLIHGEKEQSPDFEILSAEAAKVTEEISLSFREQDNETVIMAENCDQNVNPFATRVKVAVSPPVGRRSAFNGSETFTSIESKVNTFDFNVSEAGPDTAGEQFQSEEIFRDPATFDFLSQLGSSSSRSDLAKQSLYVKFDPLVGFTSNTTSDIPLPSLLDMQPNQSETNPATEEQPEASESTAVPEPTKPVETAVEEPHEREPSPPPRTPPRTKAAALATEKLISLSPAVGPSTPAVKKVETNATVSSTPAPATTKDSTSRGQVVTQDELVKRLQEHQIVLEEQDKAYQDRIADLQRENEQLNKKIQEKAQGLNQLSLIMKEYEKTISRLVAEKEQEKKAHEEDKENIIKERDSVQGHLNNIEIAFADLHKKYERSKAMIEGFKKNEEVLNAAAAENKANLDKMQSMYDLLKSHAVQKLETANQELVAIQQRHTQETAKLNAIVKKLEIKSRSLEESLEQKTKENQALAQICDELINSNN